MNPTWAQIPGPDGEFFAPLRATTLNDFAAATTNQQCHLKRSRRTMASVFSPQSDCPGRITTDGSSSYAALAIWPSAFELLSGPRSLSFYKRENSPNGKAVRVIRALSEERAPMRSPH